MTRLRQCATILNMSDVETKRLLRLAYEEAKSSTDLSTQNGAIVVRDGQVIGSGSNHFPKGVAELPHRLIRPEKYKYVVHAETQAIYDAARKGNATEGAEMFSPWAACGECAKAIIQAGITKLVVHKEAIDQSHNQWADSIKLALEMFKEAGVEYVLFSAQYKDGLELLFDGKSWQP